jgi:hypothetical protein
MNASSPASPEPALLQCQSCGAALRLAAHAMTTVCPYCASPSVVSRPASAGHVPPTFVVPFVFGREVALEHVRRWIRKARGPFTHAGLRRATVEDVRGVYVPAYLYGATAWSDWQARIGEDYTETETTTTTNEKGETVTATREVTRTEWFELAGRHAMYVRDVLVTASASVGNAELEAVEPFDLGALRRFTPAAVSGWWAEEPSLGLAECGELARREATAKIKGVLEGFVPGDRHADLAYRAVLEHEVLDPVLVPVWVLAVRYDARKPALRVLLNGQTGRVLGRAPLSWARVAVAIALVVAIVGGVVAWLVLFADGGAG